jgi:hypothetical protein
VALAPQNLSLRFPARIRSGDDSDIFRPLPRGKQLGQVLPVYADVYGRARDRGKGALQRYDQRSPAKLPPAHSNPGRGGGGNRVTNQDGILLHMLDTKVLSHEDRRHDDRDSPLCGVRFSLRSILA